MRKISRRHKKNFERTKNKIYSDLHEALNVLKETANAKFVESVELHANLNIDPKYTNQKLQATIILPNGTGKKIRIAVITNAENFDEARLAGADLIGDDDLIDAIYKKTAKFDLLIATPNMMIKLGKVSNLLGPKGLMPTPKLGTVTTDITKTLEEFKKGKFDYKADKTGTVHTSFGKSNFTNEQLIENLESLYYSIKRNRPSGIKGQYFKTLFICTTMGPSIKLDLNLFI